MYEQSVCLDKFRFAATRIYKIFLYKIYIPLKIKRENRMFTTQDLTSLLILIYTIINIIMNKLPVINNIKSCGNNKDNGIIKLVTNRVLDLIMIEINKDDMRDNIKNKIIHPLLYMIYNQLYPYIYCFIIIIFLMFIILIVILVFFILYLKK